MFIAALVTLNAKIDELVNGQTVIYLDCGIPLSNQKV